MTTIVRRLAGIFRYPVKSLRGHALPDAKIEPRGIEGDRRWMIVDEAGRFQTRRELPQMALFDVRRDGDGLHLIHPEAGELFVAMPGPDADLIKATVWRDTLLARVADGNAAAFLSGGLGKPVSLVYQHDESSRSIDPDYAADGDQVSFADGFPLLITTEASLAALNDRLADPIGMASFRPNLVISGADAWEEDRWRRLRIGDVVARIAKPCSRCIITTQHPFTGERKHGNDPLTTLREMGRMTKGGIMFGQNAIADTSGDIRIGDEVEILEEGDSNVR